MEGCRVEKMSSSEWLKLMIQYDDNHGGAEIEKEVSKLRDEAERNENLYHCTTVDGLLGILKSRTIWLSSLSAPSLNDPEEVKRIENPEYRDKVFVACFTKNKYPSLDHWDEYGFSNNGIIFRFSKEWVTGEFSVVDEEWKHIELKNDFDGYLAKTKMDNQLFVSYTNYYAVRYDNNIIKQHVDLPQRGAFLHLEAMGLVKPKKGKSSRTHKMRNWEEEEEIRYRTIIGSFPFNEKIYFYKIAAELTDDAFSTLEMCFSPLFPEDKKAEVFDKLRSVNPNMEIKCFDNGNGSI